RLQAIAVDAGTRVVLASKDVFEQLPALQSHASAMPDTQWLCTADLDDRADEWRRPDIDGDTLMFLQYTSGSTGVPRGAMVRHRNLLHNLRYMQGAFGYGADEVVCNWMPMHHDMGLILYTLEALYSGGHCVF